MSWCSRDTASARQAPPKEEGNGGKRVDARERRQVARQKRRADVGPQEQHGDDRRRRRKRQRVCPQLAIDAFGGMPPREHVQEHRAGAQAEQRERDREKREVAPSDDGKEARDPELNQQDRRRDARHSCQLRVRDAHGRWHTTLYFRACLS
jgi:hypothetical protein